MKELESYKGDCPGCGAEDVTITPSPMNADRHICFNCGCNIFEPRRTVPVNTAAAEAAAWDMTPMVEDMEYDKREEKVLDADPEVGMSRAAVSKRIRRRQRAAELQRAAANGKVVLR